MVRNGDVMRSDRLKQVMQEIDGTFDEKNLGISKFSKFCHEAAQKGLLVRDQARERPARSRAAGGRRAERGQRPAARPAVAAAGAPRRRGCAQAVAAAPAPPRRPAAEGEERETRGRRGRRGGRGRNRGERTEDRRRRSPPSTSGGVGRPESRAVAAPESFRSSRRGHAGGRARARATQPVAAEGVPRERGARGAGRTQRAPAAPRRRVDRRRRESGSRATRRSRSSATPSRRSRPATTPCPASACDRRRSRFSAATARASASGISPASCAMRTTATCVDLRKRGDAFEVAAAASVPSVADQLEVKEAALKAAAAQEKAANAVVGPAWHGTPQRAGPRRTRRVRRQDVRTARRTCCCSASSTTRRSPAPRCPAEKPARRSRARKGDAGTGGRSGRSKPARTRVPRPKKAARRRDAAGRCRPAFYARDTDARRARPARRGARVHRARHSLPRPHRRNRGVHGRGRSRLSRRGGPHGAHRGAVRAAGPRLRVLHLRHALVRQRGHATRGAAKRGAHSRRRADRGHRGHAPSPAPIRAIAS